MKKVAIACVILVALLIVVGAFSFNAIENNLESSQPVEIPHVVEIETIDNTEEILAEIIEWSRNAFNIYFSIEQEISPEEMFAKAESQRLGIYVSPEIFDFNSESFVKFTWMDFITAEQLEIARNYLDIPLGMLTDRQLAIYHIDNVDFSEIPPNYDVLHYYASLPFDETVVDPRRILAATFEAYTIINMDLFESMLEPNDPHFRLFNRRFSSQLGRDVSDWSWTRIDDSSEMTQDVEFNEIGNTEEIMASVVEEARNWTHLLLSIEQEITPEEMFARMQSLNHGIDISASLFDFRPEQLIVFTWMDFITAEQLEIAREYLGIPQGMLTDLDLFRYHIRYSFDEEPWNFTDLHYYGSLPFDETTTDPRRILALTFEGYMAINMDIFEENLPPNDRHFLIHDRRFTSHLGRAVAEWDWTRIAYDPESTQDD